MAVTPWAPPPPPHHRNCGLQHGGCCDCRPQGFVTAPRPPRHLDPGYDLGSGRPTYYPERRSRWRRRRLGSAAARWAAPGWFLAYLFTWGRQGKPLFYRERYYVGLCGCPECGDAETEMLRRDFQAAYRGGGGAGRVLVLGEGSKYERCPPRSGDTHSLTGNMGTR